MHWHSPRPPCCSKKIYTVLRSPHVNKDSREQFEVRPRPAQLCMRLSSTANSRSGKATPPAPRPAHCRTLCLVRCPPTPACLLRPAPAPQVRLHQRLIDVKDLSSSTIDRLMTLDLPAGVDVEVRAGAGRALPALHQGSRALGHPAEVHACGGTAGREGLP